MIKLFGMKNALIFNIQIISQIWSHKNVVPDTYFNQGIFCISVARSFDADWDCTVDLTRVHYI